MVTPAPHQRQVTASFALLAGILVVAGFMAITFAPRAANPIAIASPSPTASPAVAPSPAATTVAAANALVVAKVTGAHPLLLPSTIPATWSAVVTNLSSSFFTITYTSPDGAQEVEFAIVVPNPPPPGQHGSQANPKFHGDKYSLYQVGDTTQPAGPRFLVWNEPGTWAEPNGLPGVPYMLSTAGMTEAQFWTIANSLSSTSSSPAGVDYGPPPPGVQLLWVQDPNHPGWLIGFDWAGKPRGAVKLPQQVGEFDRLSAAPDGSAFGFEPNGKGGYHLFFDQLGNPIGSAGSAVFYQRETWADDSRHVCTLDQSGGHWSLGLAQPGADPKPVNEIALDPSSLARSGIIAFSFAACSARNDRTVITYFYTGRPTAYSVVRISDGAILQQRAYPAGQVDGVVASVDGSLIAENSDATVIRRASDLSMIAGLDPTLRVIAFSGDNSSVLVTAPMGAGLPANQEVVDLQTGRVVWRGEGTSALSAFAVQPAGNAFAIALIPPGQTNQPATILIVYGDGSRPAKLPGLLIPTF